MEQGRLSLTLVGLQLLGHASAAFAVLQGSLCRSHPLVPPSGVRNALQASYVMEALHIRPHVTVTFRTALLAPLQPCL